MIRRVSSVFAWSWGSSESINSAAAVKRSGYGSTHGILLSCQQLCWISIGGDQGCHAQVPRPLGL
eukprot:1182473-Prorocentrum_minimum.AAC.2